VPSTLLDSIFDGVYVLDQERRIIFWNRAADEITDTGGRMSWGVAATAVC